MRKRSARRSAATLTAANLISQLLGFCYRVTLSRTVGAEGMGLFQLIFPYLSLVTALAVSGICVAVSRLAAEYQALGDGRSLGLLTRRAIGLFFSIFAVVALGTAFGANNIAAGFLGDIRTRLAVLLLIPEVFFTGIENIHKNYLYGIGEVTAPAFSDVMEQVVRMGAVLLLLRRVPWRTGEEMLGLIAAGMCICEIASALFLRCVCRRKRRSAAVQSRRTGKDGITGRLLRTAVPVSASNLVNNLLSALIVVLIPRRLEVSGLSHAQALAEYGTLFGMAMPLLLLPTALIFGIGLVIVPKLSEYQALGDRAAVQSSTARAISAVSYLVLPVLAVLVPLGQPLIRVFYGAEIESRLLLPLACGVALSIYMGLFGSILNGLGKPGAAAFGAISGNALELVLVYLLVSEPYLRMNGYVISFLASVVLTAGSNLWFVIRTTGLRIKAVDWFLLPLLSAGGAALTARLVLRLCTSKIGERPALVLAVGAAAAVYLGLVAFQRGGKLTVRKKHDTIEVS